MPTPELEQTFTRLWLKFADGKDLISTNEATKFVAAMYEEGHGFNLPLDAKFMESLAASSDPSGPSRRRYCPMLALTLSCTDVFFEASDWTRYGEPTVETVKHLLYKALEHSAGQFGIKSNTAQFRDMACTFHSFWVEMAGSYALRMPFSNAMCFAQRMSSAFWNTWFGDIEAKLPQFEELGYVPFLAMIEVEYDIDKWLEFHYRV